MDQFKEERDLLLKFVLSQLPRDKIILPDGVTLDTLSTMLIKVPEIIDKIKAGKMSFLL